MSTTFTPALFDQFRLTQAERNLGVYGIHVYQEGQGDIEHRFRSDDRVFVWSASKTFTAVAIGMCVDEGRLALTDSVLGFFPEWAAVAAPGSEAITVRDLLRMSCGKDYPMFQETDPDVMEQTDWAELFFRGEVTSTPGTKFFYANGASYMLGRVVEAVSGTPLREFLQPRLFVPLHILNPWWNADPLGHTLAAYGLQLTTTELAKMGQLLLQQGVWQDKQLVSAAYVEAMHTDTIMQNQHFPDEESNAGYGYQVWCNTRPGTYRADGLYGQYSLVFPEQRAVVTTTSHNEVDACGIIRAVYADIIPRLA
ncbi:MAG: beta-lactamase family protein [Bifidobacteriaceae bacterium]|jgi:CubicO group peptidase (beta-lactamase class C family)|nr:beta-lactamase family protein [Bifidobacteriaceae bacterium]